MKNSIDIIINNEYSGSLFCSRYEISEINGRKHLYVFTGEELIYSLTEIDNYEIAKDSVYDIVYITR